ncbi:hypothetical protein FE257_010059 [Aspergillus nanangensis]|uniref:FAD-binding PCMH-type domain-containing protein n=1 Tax=Aspergillus nanangensis TaxID=2582783 RepID=A0AAD4CWA7_ASPNN|nr:hypothetical protein FE257_010059 [Aspergillus nanangensis]
MIPRTPPLSTVLSLLALLCAIYLALAPTRVNSRCRNRPGDPGWPSLSAWSHLNASLNFNLVDLRPIASVCHEPISDQPACNIVQRMSSSGRWRTGQPGALINTFWESGFGSNETCSLSDWPESCHQGRIPLYAALVESPQEVQTAVNFARQHNLRLVVRNTGHDGAGSSSGPDTFQIFTGRLDSIQYHPAGSNRSVGAPAVSVGAGVLIGDLYAHGRQNGFIVTGGDSATVGAAGGFIQGGGVPGFLGYTWGLAVDNVVEFEVVTAAGDLITANANQHADLFWALRGGGGGTFGVVVRVTMLAYPDHRAVKSTISVSGDGQSPSFWSQDIAALLGVIQALNRQGTAGVFRLWQTPAGQLAASTEMYFLNQTDEKGVSNANRVVTALLGGTTASERYAISTTLLDSLSSDVAADVPTITELFGSTLISNTLFHSEDGPRLLAERMSQIGLRDGEWLLTSNLGGRVNDPRPRGETPLHPAWGSSAQLVSLVVNVDSTEGGAVRDRAMQRLTHELMPKMYALDPGAQRVSYRNMGDPNEPGFQDVYWGAANYERLDRIKRDWDPRDLFISRVGVGSERWDFEGVCRSG